MSHIRVTSGSGHLCAETVMDVANIYQVPWSRKGHFIILTKAYSHFAKMNTVKVAADRLK